MIKGWNTFDVTLIIIVTKVLLPDGMALNLQTGDIWSGDSLVLMFTGNRVKGSERLRTIAHTPDGYLSIATPQTEVLRRRRGTHFYHRGALLVMIDLMENAGYGTGRSDLRV